MESIVFNNGLSFSPIYHRPSPYHRGWSEMQSLTCNYVPDFWGKYFDYLNWRQENAPPMTPLYDLEVLETRTPVTESSNPNTDPVANWYHLGIINLRFEEGELWVDRVHVNIFEELVEAEKMQQIVCNLFGLVKHYSAKLGLPEEIVALNISGRWANLELIEAASTLGQHIFLPVERQKLTDKTVHFSLSIQ